MPVLSQLTSLLVWLLRVESSVVSKTTGSVLSDGAPVGDDGEDGSGDEREVMLKRYV